jgi:hypothetical protein
MAAVTSSSTNCHTRYAVVRGARQALEDLRRFIGNQLPPEADCHLGQVTFSTSSDGHTIYFPCPLKENEAAAALKAMEASAVAAVADLRFGAQKRKIDVNLEKTAAFLFSAYVSTIGGMGKGDPGVKSKLKGESCVQPPFKVTNASHRYGFIRSTIYSISKIISKLVPNKEAWGILSYSRVS